jgi:hypothetical protein
MREDPQLEMRKEFTRNGLFSESRRVLFYVSPTACPPPHHPTRIHIRSE